MEMLNPISRRDFIKSSIVAGAATAAGAQPMDAATPSNDPATPLRFGVNYTPRKRWWYCWQDWDQASIIDDLSAIGELGMDHIRIQCLWPIFQPGINHVSDSVLHNLTLLMEAADRAGLDVEVTVLNGWMSGLEFMPAWVAPLVTSEHGKAGNMFTDQKVIEAEKLLFLRIAETVGKHRRFLGFDLGNELGVVQALNNQVTPDQADAWATQLLQYCEEIAPGKFHVNGVDDVHWFSDFGFSRQNLATTGKATVVHCYVFFTGALDRYKYSDAGSLRLAEYMVELAYAYHTDLKRRVWVEEIGASAEWMPADYLPEFMERVVTSVASTGKAWGITWWSSHDIDPGVKGFSSLEYTLGLLDLDNKPKPMGRKFAALARELRRSPPPAAQRRLVLVIPDHGLSKKNWPPDWSYGKAFMNLVARGQTPAIVLESRARDAEYLRARGIEELVLLAKAGE
jgi:hypothetical protein